MDTRQYKSSDPNGLARDPALLKEMEDYIKTHQPPKAKRQSGELDSPLPGHLHRHYITTPVPVGTGNPGLLSVIELGRDL